MRQFKILLVDDEQDYLDVFRMILKAKGYDARMANSGKEALDILRQCKYDLLITDLIMPEMSGLELLEAVKQYEMPVIISTGYGTVKNAVDAMKQGATGYFIKSHDPDELLLEIKRIEKNRQTIQVPSSDYLLETKSKSFAKVLNTLERAANSDVNILLLGESGVGKEVVANYIHLLSDRKKEAFIAVNCHAFSENLLESELFGHEKGAFTGADKKRIGRFEAADYGTLFLDEIGDTNPSIQVKLLRALETKSIERLGSNQKIELDFRLIAATNRDIDEMVKTEAFREDLYYRLSTITVEIPPLRERREDIEELVHFFVERSKAEMKKSIKSIDPEVIDYLKNYDFPGNVRELKNIIERLVVLSDGVLKVEDLPQNLSKSQSFDSLKSVREYYERNHIENVLMSESYNMTKSAEVLHISRRQLFNLIEKYHIEK